MRQLGKQLSKTDEIFSLFTPAEGAVSFYYGRLGSGKTYMATADILDLLRRGEVVFANWQIDFEGFDERKNFMVSLVKTLFFRKRFFSYDKSNFHYFSPDINKDEDIGFLGNLVGVHLFFDEGQWIFNSKDRNENINKRKLILHNRHYCRSLNIVSQRPMNVVKDMRSQVNIWYKCNKVLTFPFTIFSKTPIEDMKEDMPDEDNPNSRPSLYLGRQSVFRAYNTHAMRADGAIQVGSEFEVYSLGFIDKLRAIFMSLFSSGDGGRPNDIKKPYKPKL